jgi:diacylglycerol kinase family enzyme
LTGFLIVNPRSGDGGTPTEELESEARSLGVVVHVLGEDDDLERLAREADADALGMAGGDGSLAAVAGVAVERKLPFVCIPYGTRNHFARDLGLDRDDPVGALAAFAGHERRIDLGRANGRAFLNNVSLGLYARLVHRREHHRRRGQLFARARAYALLLQHRHPLELTLDGEQLDARIVLVANNSYSVELFSVGDRERLDEGCLHLYSAGGLVPGTWDERKGPRFTIGAAGPKLTVAVDGDPVELETPLEFTVEPGALRVLVPPGVEHGRDDRERELVARR